MAASHGKNAKVYLTDSGGTERDISSYVTSVTMPQNADTADTSGLNDAAHSHVPGLKDNSVSLEGNRDITVEGYLYGVIGVATVIRYFPEGSASAKAFYQGTAILTGLETSSSVDDANKFSAEGVISGTVGRTVLA